MAKKKTKRSDIAFRNAYVSLLMNEENDRIFVRTICEKAGYSAMCFYQNYVNKDAFSQHIIDDEVDFYIENLHEFSDLMKSGNATKEECIKCRKKFFDRVCENRDLYNCIFYDKLIDETDHYFENRIGQEIIKSSDTNEERTKSLTGDSFEFDREWTAGKCETQNDYTMWFLVRHHIIRYLLAEQWLKNGFNLSAYEISESLYNMMMMLDSGALVSKFG